MYTNVLIPLDTSDSASAILVRLRQFLKKNDGDVTLLHALQIYPPHVGPVTEVREELEKAATAQLQELCAELKTHGVNATGIVRQTETPAETILEVARETEASLIALSTHGYSGISRWMYGSVTEKILRSSDVPLLILPSFELGDGDDHSVAAATEISIKNVLVPLDGSTDSLEVLPHAAALARLMGAGAETLHVYTSDEELPYAKSRMDALRERIEKPFKVADIKVEHLRTGGDPALEIVKARENSPDTCIAMTTHGHTGLDRWTLGSVAEKVLRSRPGPVLVVRSSSERELG